MFLPTTREEMEKAGWDRPDIILVTGDTYIDSPFIGTAVIGNVLAAAGYRVGVIAQPDTASGTDITRLGEPALFWGVSGGSVDSMVANYTALKKRRKSDDFTPGGENTRRPDRAAIAYTNLIRRFFKETRPIVLGGLEASLRRVAHYDFWDDAVRRSVLFDAKADFLVYGMGEKAVLALAQALKDGTDPRDVRGLCYASKEPKEGYLILPSFEEVSKDPAKLTEMFTLFYENADPLTAQGLCQKQNGRYLVQNPPAPLPTQEELDGIYGLEYTREVHPYYRRLGEVRANETIKFSLTTHRGCYGECNFCSIAVHQGRTVISRSERSILDEAQSFTRHPAFKGTIADVGGPTANMYCIECQRKTERGACRNRRCLAPKLCPEMRVDHRRQVELLRKLSRIPGVKNVFVASGIRYDLVLEDRACGREYLRELIERHTSGQLKVAPEHTEEKVLRVMGKPGAATLPRFKAIFEELNRKAGRRQFLTYYFIAAHPGCGEDEMRRLKDFTRGALHLNPEQVQIFTPLPSTYSTLMYYTGRDPFTGERLFVEKEARARERQKETLTAKGPVRRRPRRFHGPRRKHH